MTCDQCKDKLVTKFPVVGHNDSRAKSYFKIDRVWRIGRVDLGSGLKKLRPSGNWEL